MRGWYGPPIALAGVPGEVYVTKDDFVGYCKDGGFANGEDMLFDVRRRLKRAWSIKTSDRRNQLNVGFANLHLTRTAYKVWFPWGYTGFSSTNPGQSQCMWYGPGTTNIPPAGSAASAAPGGRVPVGGTNGGWALGAAPTGMNWYFGGGAAQAGNQGAGNSMMVYDRLFDVAKTMSSTTTENVTGVPTRYQSTTASDPDYIGGNFLFLSNSATMGSTARTWSYNYTNHANAAQSSSASASATAFATCNMEPLTTDGRWFYPLAAGDVGIKNLTQMTCSASVTGTLDFAIGHPIAWMPNLTMGTLQDVGGITSAFNMVRIFDNACLSLIDACSVSTLQQQFGNFFVLAA